MRVTSMPASRRCRFSAGELRRFPSRLKRLLLQGLARAMLPVAGSVPVRRWALGAWVR